MQIKGILSFPVLFTPKPPKGSDVSKYGLSLLIPGNDPQVAAIQAEVDAAKQNTFPSGFPNSADVCFEQYDIKYAGKEYYDPRFSGWYIFSCSAKAEDKPAVVDGALKPVMDPGLAHSGAVVWVNAGISGYTKGTGGVGGWLNGVMLTGEEPPMGRLDNKPSVEQMFAGTPQSANAAPATNAAPAPAPAPNAAPAPAPAPNAAPAPQHAAQYVMTAAAQGTREWYHASNWTDVMLIEHGLMLPPGGVPTSF